MRVVASFALLGTAVTLGTTGALASPRPVHRVSVELRGPVALVEVERSLEKAGGPGQEAVLDLDLPDGAVPVSFQVGSGARFGTAALAGARETLRAALAARDLTAGRQPMEEGTDLRIHVAAPASPALRVRYRYAVPLACRSGRLVLRVPGSLEPEPLAAEVSVHAAGKAIDALDLVGMPLGRVRRGSGRAPARAAWELSFAPDAAWQAATAPRGALALAGCAAEARGADRALPDRVLLVIDRSRSVGSAGVGAERDLARALLQALPPSVRFNAVFFDRAATVLFPLFREATREALSALDDRLVPAELRNGSDVAVALRRAADVASADTAAATARDLRTWVVVVTDGALPESLAPASIDGVLAGFPAAQTSALAFVLRPHGDDAAPPRGEELLRALPARLGGVLRVVDAAAIGDAVTDAAAAMRRGGDTFAVTVAGVPVLAQVAAGRGSVRVVKLPPGAAAVSLTARTAGGAIAAHLHPLRLDEATGAALLAAAPAAWSASRGLVAMVEPGPRATAPDDVIRGDLDRAVVRNALSLAYLPRARACYLRRRVRVPADAELHGRLRLELHLERGEVQDVVVRSSTLQRPDIESCLRDAAFSIEVPRPMHRDAPTVAIMNLVFQPSSPPRGGQDASALDREIDLLVGPLSPDDPLQLLER
jgi:hypothetical protein